MNAVMWRALGHNKRPKDYADQLVRDVWQVVNFCADRRRRHADVREAFFRMLNGLDVDALRFLCTAIEHRGAFGPAEWRAILRLRRALNHEDQWNDLLVRWRSAA